MAAIGMIAGLVLVGCGGEPTPTPQLVTATLIPRTPVPTATNTPPAPTLTPVPTAIPTAVPTRTLVPTATPGPSGVPDYLALVDVERMFGVVNRLAAFGNRHVLSPPDPAVGILAARAYLMGQLIAIQQAYPQAGIEVFTQPFDFVFANRSLTAENLALVLPGTDPAAGVVIVGAHYDTIGAVASDFRSDQPGADDNGSGVAAVLEMARLSALGSHRATLVFALFAAEETGRHGSQAFVRDVVATRGWDVRAMINLDGIGSPDGPDGTVQPDMIRVYSAPPDTSSSRTLAREAAAIAARYLPGLRVNVEGTLDREGRWGDHQSFSDAGYPAIRLIEPFDDPARTHSPEDRLTVLDAAYWRRSTQFALAVALSLAG